MSDFRGREPEDELKRYWQETTLDERDSKDPNVAAELSSRVDQFDRKIFWRNFREYAAGLVVLIWSGFRAFKGDRPSIGMVAGVTFVMVYLWWKHRKIGQPDLSTNVRIYEEALLERYDKQIRLLSRVRYWYLLPLYIPIVWSMLARLQRNEWGAIFALAIVTAAFVFIGWLNEKVVVGQLRVARAKLTAMREEKESDGLR